MHAVLAIMCCVAAVGDTSERATVVAFTDSSLEAAIRAAIAKPVGDILEEDLVELFRIEAVNAGILSLDGIGHCTQLKVLELSGNGISDIHPLESLQALFSLDLSGNAIRDISALAGLVRLNLLNLKNNLIEDVAPLSQLPRLSNLSLDGNAIENIAPLAANPSLAEGDIVSLFDNPLPPEACDFIDALGDRGVFVLHDLACDSLPGEPRCPVAGLADIEGEAAATLLGENWNTCDLDDDGIPDSYAVALVSELLCRAADSMNADLRAAYSRNLSLLSSEPLYAASWMNIKEVLVVYTLIDTSSSHRIAERLSFANEYSPFVFDGMEVLSSTGDPDGDGITNHAEYEAVASNRGSAADYVLAALTPAAIEPDTGEGEGEGEGEAEEIGPDIPFTGCHGIIPVLSSGGGRRARWTVPARNSGGGFRLCQMCVRNGRSFR